MTGIDFAFDSRRIALTPPELARRLRRVPSDRSTVDETVTSRVRAIIASVRDEGDATLVRLGMEFDRSPSTRLEVPRAEWERARRSLDPAVRAALERAAANIQAAHEAFRPLAQEFVTADGVILARRPDALARVGVYAPGGRATYPSSLLMGVIPARAAGVGEIIVCSPGDASGLPSPVLMAAASVAGADRLFAVGGAGAIAAMTYGTQTIPRVDRIVGPGNAYVAEAKLQVARMVGIDSPAGPSELLIIADTSAAPEVVAREMLAQAEHDPDAAVLLVALGDSVADSVTRALESLIATEPRDGIIRQALALHGGVVIAATLDEAISLANEWAPEHLLLALQASRLDDAAARLRNCGTIFLGESSSVAFGDYLTGANHVLPTSGFARAYSGLSTTDFMRWTTTQRVDRASAAALAGDVQVLASAEGLPAHARAAKQWEVA